MTVQVVTYSPYTGLEGVVVAGTTLDAVVLLMRVHGYEVGPVTTSKRIRPELRGQPTFSGLHGPMWGGTTADGGTILRYETRAAYDLLST